MGEKEKGVIKVRGIEREIMSECRGEKDKWGRIKKVRQWGDSNTQETRKSRFIALKS